jgi:hypothetical protein
MSFAAIQQTCVKVYDSIVDVFDSQSDRSVI